MIICDITRKPGVVAKAKVELSKDGDSPLFFELDLSDEAYTALRDRDWKLLGRLAKATTVPRSRKGASAPVKQATVPTSAGPAPSTAPAQAAVEPVLNLSTGFDDEIEDF